MANIITRSTGGTDGSSVKGSNLTNQEIDNNFININDDVFVDNFPGQPPSLQLNFRDQLDPRITFTRTGTSATYFDSKGTLVTVGANVPRFDYNPNTLQLNGLLVEESRTNSVPNSTMAGAVVSGSLPTGWTDVTPSIVRTVQAVTSINGMNYIDIKLTASGTANYLLYPQGTGGVIAAQRGQVWATSIYLARVGGSMTGVGTAVLETQAIDAGGVNIVLGQGQTSNLSIASTGNLTTTRTTVINSFTASGVSYVRPRLNIALSAGADITLRIGIWQLENNGVNSTLASATVASGGTGYTVGNTLTITGGTGTAATLTVTTVSSGVITGVSVLSAGNYSVFPPTDPVSVTGGSGTGATFNLTPNTLSGFVTSPIPTSTAAVTRGADTLVINNLAPWYYQPEGSVYAEFMNMVQGSATQYNASQGVWSITQSALGQFNGYGMSTNLNTNTTSFINFRSRYAPTAKNDNVAIGQASTFIGSNTVYKTVCGWDSAQITADSNISTVGTATNNAAVDMGTHNQMTLGNQNTGGAPPYQLNGWLRRINYYPRRLTASQMAALCV